MTAISAVFTGAADTEVAVEAHRRVMDEAEGLADWYEFTIADAGEVVSVGEPVPEDLLGMIRGVAFVRAARNVQSARQVVALWVRGASGTAHHQRVCVRDFVLQQWISHATLSA